MGRKMRECLIFICRKGLKVDCHGFLQKPRNDDVDISLIIKTEKLNTLK